jgi:hypothetical protein
MDNLTYELSRFFDCNQDIAYIDTLVQEIQKYTGVFTEIDNPYHSLSKLEHIPDISIFERVFAELPFVYTLAYAKKYKRISYQNYLKTLHYHDVTRLCYTVTGRISERIFDRYAEIKRKEVAGAILVNIFDISELALIEHPTIQQILEFVSQLLNKYKFILKHAGSCVCHFTQLLIYNFVDNMVFTSEDLFQLNTIYSEIHKEHHFQCVFQMIYIKYCKPKIEYTRRQDIEDVKQAMIKLNISRRFNCQGYFEIVYCVCVRYNFSTVNDSIESIIAILFKDIHHFSNAEYHLKFDNIPFIMDKEVLVEFNDMHLERLTNKLIYEINNSGGTSDIKEDFIYRLVKNFSKAMEL